MCPDLGGGYRFGVATVASTPLSRVQNQQGIWGCTRECRLEVSNCFDHMITIVQQQSTLATVTQFHHVWFLQRRRVPTPEEKHLAEAQQIQFLIFCPWVTSDTQKETHWHCQYVLKPMATNKKQSSRITMLFVGKSYARSKSVHQFLGKYGKKNESNNMVNILWMGQRNPVVTS